MGAGVSNNVMKGAWVYTFILRIPRYLSTAKRDSVDNASIVRTPVVFYHPS